MLKLRTGMPGSGKTLKVLHDYKDGVYFPAHPDTPEVKIKRPIFYHRIKDLNPALGWIPLNAGKIQVTKDDLIRAFCHDDVDFEAVEEHAKRLGLAFDDKGFLFAEIKNRQGKIEKITHFNGIHYWFVQVPFGAIVIIDEIQKDFPQRHSTAATPFGLQILETHRHLGLDLVWITQHPSLVDSHIRRLTGEHTHLQRNFGANFSICYVMQSCSESLSSFDLKLAEKTNFVHPKETFELYKSAEIHTHKFKIPKIVFTLLILLVLFALLFSYMVYDYYKKTHPAQTAQTTQSTQVTQQTAHNNRDNEFSGSGDIHKVDINSFVPVIPNVPASAPVYQSGWKAKSVPIISSCIGDATHCRCYTQQATPVAVTDEFCKTVVLSGLPFDHTLADPRFQGENRAQH